MAADLRDLLRAAFRWTDPGAGTLLGPRYVGAAVIVDESPPPVRAELVIRGMLSGADLGGSP